MKNIFAEEVSCREASCREQWQVHTGIRALFSTDSVALRVGCWTHQRRKEER